MLLKDAKHSLIPDLKKKINCHAEQKYKGDAFVFGFIFQGLNSKSSHLSQIFSMNLSESVSEYIMHPPHLRSGISTSWVDHDYGTGLP